jgi:mycothiol maleylpyruvate isomerase-like protein
MTDAAETPDYDRLRYEELASISEFCHGLDAARWDTSSRCEGWRVRDVIGHMSLGYTTGLRSVATDVDWSHGRR